MINYIMERMKTMIKRVKNYFVNRKENNGNYEVRKHGGKEIIMEFALGAIAVVLAVVFRDQLETVISTVGSSFSDKINALFTSL